MNPDKSVSSSSTSMLLKSSASSSSSSDTSSTWILVLSLACFWEHQIHHYLTVLSPLESHGCCCQWGHCRLDLVLLLVGTKLLLLHLVLSWMVIPLLPTVHSIDGPSVRCVFGFCKPCWSFGLRQVVILVINNPFLGLSLLFIFIKLT